MLPNVADISAKGMLVLPDDHFKGGFEVERRFQVDDFAGIRDRLGQNDAAASMIGNSETDFFFDLPDGRLAQNNRFQALRHMKPPDRVIWISKGPGKDQCLATEFAEFDNSVTLLNAIGFVETAQISKKNDIYFLDEFHVKLDDVDGLGKFVELAIATDDENQLPMLRARTERMVERLGLQNLAEETSSYRELLLD